MRLAVSHLWRVLMHVWPFSHWQQRTDASKCRGAVMEEVLKRQQHELIGRLNLINLRTAEYGRFGINMADRSATDPEHPGSGDYAG